MDIIKNVGYRICLSIGLIFLALTSYSQQTKMIANSCALYKWNETNGWEYKIILKQEFAFTFSEDVKDLTVSSIYGQTKYTITHGLGDPRRSDPSRSFIMLNKQKRNISTAILYSDQEKIVIESRDAQYIYMIDSTGYSTHYSIHH